MRNIPCLGCNLSPLLFLIFLATLGLLLNKTGLGIDIGDENIASLLFADDLSVFGIGKQAFDELIRITEDYLSKHKLQISQTKSKILSHCAETGELHLAGGLTLDQVLFFKYLGVDLNCSPRSLFKSFNQAIRRKASGYVARVFSLVRSGPNRAILAYTLWVKVATPAFLYGSEIIPLTKETLSHLERCQLRVGKFLLQIEESSASSAVHIDAGLKPMWALVAERVLNYWKSVLMRPENILTTQAMKEQLAMGMKSEYFRNLCKWKALTGVNGIWNNNIQELVNKAAMKYVLNQQLSKPTAMALNHPQGNNWFSHKAWIGDDLLVKNFAEFRVMNAGLGNRKPAPDGGVHKECVLCSRKGLAAKNDEVHLVIDCQSMAPFRNTCSIGSFVRVYKSLNWESVEIFKLLLDDSREGDLDQKLRDLLYMKCGWSKIMGFNNL